MKTLFRRLRKAIALPILRLFYRIIRVDKIYKSYLYEDSKEIPADVRYCLILGALLFNDDSITPMLTKRLDAAIELFKARPHLTFILSGDGSKRFSNDVQAMYTYLKQHSSIPDEQILFDNHGYTSLDSARYITPEMDAAGFILLTSSFHMPRCVYICHRLGLHPYALYLPASHSHRNSGYQNRELLSLVKAWYILTFGQPEFHKGIHKLLFEVSFLSGKLLSLGCRLLKRRYSNLPGKVVLRLCPYFLQYATESLSLTFIVGTSSKQETYHLLEQEQKGLGCPLFPATSRACSPEQVASFLLLGHRGLFFQKTTAQALFNCNEIDFYKITRQVTSKDVQIYITDLAGANELIRNHILTGIDEIPCAVVHINQASETAVALKDELTNHVRFFTLGEHA